MLIIVRVYNLLKMNGISMGHWIRSLYTHISLSADNSRLFEFFVIPSAQFFGRLVWLSSVQTNHLY